jgi:predicted Zn finger-like uncharacterized protein
MYTFCPSCSTVFAVNAEHLLAAGGRVRCGNCGLVFRAFDYVYEELDVAQSALADHRARQVEQVDQVEEEDEVSAQPGKEEAESQATDDRDIVNDVIAVGYPLSREYSATWPTQHNLRRTVAKGMVIAVLLLLLGVQWVYFNRNVLAAQHNWRPGLQTLCAVLHCDLPLQVDRSRIELLNRDVRKHPRVASALLINAILVNRAAFPQPYPTLEVTFSNSSGTPVAARRFSPAEYLGGHVDLKAGMPVDVPLQVVLEIKDPGDDAVSFQFEFL